MQAGNRDVAFALFPALSMLNHSCAPNCVYANMGAHLMGTSLRKTPDNFLCEHHSLGHTHRDAASKQAPSLASHPCSARQPSYL